VGPRAVFEGFAAARFRSGYPAFTFLLLGQPSALLQEGTKVDFEVVQGKKGPQASAVKIVA
jgi:hypothetical protein